MKIAIITGPRTISAADAQLVRNVVGEIIRRGFQIYVGDAAGVDFVVARETLDIMKTIFWPRPDLGRTPAGLAERSTRMVKEALHAAGNDEIICIGFPNKACPTGIVPARSWRSGNPGSGTWSTLAMAVGHDIETWIIPISGCAISNFFLNSWPSCDWQQFGQYFAGWHFTPAPSLFAQEVQS